MSQFNSIDLYRRMEAYRRELPPCPECGSPTTCAFRAAYRMAKKPKFRAINPKCTNYSCPSNTDPRRRKGAFIKLPEFVNEYDN